MKRFIPIICILFFTSLAAGQPIQKAKPLTIPLFDIVQADGGHFRATDLQPDIPVMIVYFDPGCEHCEVFINDLKSELNAFKHVQIVLVTFVPVKQLKSFMDKANLHDGLNLKIGTEGDAFTVRYHYDVIQLPFVALHDGRGQLFASYESIVPPARDLVLMFTK
jgi:hypothetical protein